MSGTADVDVIVAGGGVAGTRAAAALQQIGHDVLLIEPGLHDARRLAGELIHPPGVAGLAELGLLEALATAPAVAIDGFSLFADPNSRQIRLPYSLVPAHSRAALSLEHGLIRQRLFAAVSALPNIRVERGARVIGVDQSDPSCVTVLVAQDKTVTRYRARLLVGADGAQSRIGQLAGIKQRKRSISTILGYSVSARNLPTPGFGHVFLGAATPVLAYEIAPDTTRILFDVPRLAGMRASPADCLELAAALPADLRREVEGAIAAQPRTSIAAQAVTTERLTVGRVVLVGDAGGSCHPLTATGMTMCVGDALLLRHALRSAKGDVKRALSVYEHRRRWPRRTRATLADGLREAFSDARPELRVVREGIFSRLDASASARTATLALLSTADGRPSALIRQVVAAMARGMMAEVVDRRGAGTGQRVMAYRTMIGLGTIFFRQIGQIMGLPQ
jgi:2-polyprenyl-6-methoxyphenol hydroxylase-like FAD-dependent oxidoreductase